MVECKDLLNPVRFDTCVTRKDFCLNQSECNCSTLLKNLKYFLLNCRVTVVYVKDVYWVAESTNITVGQSITGAVSPTTTTTQSTVTNPTTQTIITNPTTSQDSLGPDSTNSPSGNTVTSPRPTTPPMSGSSEGSSSSTSARDSTGDAYDGTNNDGNIGRKSLGSCLVMLIGLLTCLLIS